MSDPLTNQSSGWLIATADFSRWAHLMKTISVEQQIALLRPAIGFVAHMHRWFLLGAALGVIVAVYFWNPMPLMVSVFLAIVGCFERRAGPNIVAAIHAYDSNTPTSGEVSVAISRGETDFYHATVCEQGHSDWHYEFVPQGWQPTARNYPARIWRTSAKGQPILAIVEEGIMIPRDDPKLVQTQMETKTSA